MDGDHFVPVGIIANFNQVCCLLYCWSKPLCVRTQVKKLSADSEAVIEAVRGT